MYILVYILCKCVRSVRYRLINISTRGPMQYHKALRVAVVPEKRLNFVQFCFFCPNHRYYSYLKMQQSKKEGDIPGPNRQAHRPLSSLASRCSTFGPSIFLPIAQSLRSCSSILGPATEVKDERVVVVRAGHFGDQARLLLLHHPVPVQHALGEVVGSVIFLDYELNDFNDIPFVEKDDFDHSDFFQFIDSDLQSPLDNIKNLNLFDGGSATVKQGFQIKTEDQK